MATTSEAVALATAYVAAQTEAIVVDRSNLGVLKFTGETRLDLIHRMSTQAVNGLQRGEGTVTILTTDIGRMIDRLLLMVTSDSVYAITGENNADTVARYLMRYVFFNDDFHIENLSATTAIYGVYGRESSEQLRPLFGESVTIPRYHWRSLELDSASVYLQPTDPVAGGGFFVLCDTVDREAIWDRLVATGCVPAGQDAFDYLRIESGLPRFGHEITEEYIPLEANLWDDVSFDKGCYIGQEIIARMESRGRLAKKLVQLRGEAPLATGADIMSAGKTVGTITSTADGPVGPLALGYVKTKALANESELTFEVGGIAVRPVAAVG